MHVGFGLLITLQLNFSPLQTYWLSQSRRYEGGVEAEHLPWHIGLDGGKTQCQ